MTNERYKLLMTTDENLTLDEMSIGWHFCWEWDGLLISPGMAGEWLPCMCWEDSKTEKEQRWAATQSPATPQSPPEAGPG